MRPPAALRKRSRYKGDRMWQEESAPSYYLGDQGRTTPMSASTELQAGQVKLHQENDQNLQAGTGL